MMRILFVSYKTSRKCPPFSRDAEIEKLAKRKHRGSGLGMGGFHDVDFVFRQRAALHRAERRLERAGFTVEIGR